MNPFHKEFLGKRRDNPCKLMISDRKAKCHNKRYGYSAVVAKGGRDF
jgi:hypothetical protein